MGSSRPQPPKTKNSVSSACWLSSNSVGKILPKRYATTFFLRWKRLQDELCRKTIGPCLSLFIRERRRERQIMNRSPTASWQRVQRDNQPRLTALLDRPRPAGLVVLGHLLRDIRIV